MSYNEPLLNKYSLVKGAARRARHLLSGVRPVGAPTSLKLCRVAQDEIRAGKVTYVMPHKPAAEEY
jgi:DNA-directed RNA polymerase subunit omega